MNGGRQCWIAISSLLVLTLGGCPGGGSGGDGSAGSAGDGPEEQRELSGVWKDTSSMIIAFEGTGARLVSFGTQRVTGRQHFDVGGEYLRNIQRIDGHTFSAEIASFTREEASADIYDFLHIVGVSYVSATITVSPAFISIDSADGTSTTLLSSGSAPDAYVHGGACETKFQNLQGATLYDCDDSGTEDSCSSPGELQFWENTTCRQLGYQYQYESASFQYDEDNNGLPGAHGAWGDHTGGSGGGWTDGSGGSAVGGVVVPSGGTGGAGGTGGMSGTGGAGGMGGTGGTTWKEDTWRFVDSDKAVQSRLALVRKASSTRYIVRIQYRVNSGDTIYNGGGGYVLDALHNVVDSSGAELTMSFRMTFPGGFVLGQIFEPDFPYELYIDLMDPAYFDEAMSWPAIDNGGTVSALEFNTGCVDDSGSTPNRCTNYAEYSDVDLGTIAANNNAGE